MRSTLYVEQKPMRSTLYVEHMTKMLHLYQIYHPPVGSEILVGPSSSDNTASGLEVVNVVTLVDPLIAIFMPLCKQNKETKEFQLPSVFRMYRASL